jgi:hypothetical protein
MTLADVSFIRLQSGFFTGYFNDTLSNVTFHDNSVNEETGYRLDDLSSLSERVTTSLFTAAFWDPQNIGS